MGSPCSRKQQPTLSVWNASNAGCSACCSLPFNMALTQALPKESHSITLVKTKSDFIIFHRPHHLIIKKIKIKIEQKEKVDIKWNRWAGGMGCRTKETGNCRGPGTQEEMLIQLIGDPVLAPAVPKRGVQVPKEVVSRMEEKRERGLGLLAVPQLWANHLPP